MSHDGVLLVDQLVTWSLCRAYLVRAVTCLMALAVWSCSHWMDSSPAIGRGAIRCL
jgi:hypothetical protein